MPSWRAASALVSLAMLDPPRRRATSTKVYPGLPSRKIPRKGPVDHGRIAFAGAVRFPPHGLDIALLNMIRLPHQLALRGVILLGQAVPLLPPVGQGLQVRPGSRELRRQVRTEGRDTRRHRLLVRPWGSLEVIRRLRGRRQQRLMHGEVLRTLRGREDRRETLVDLRYTYGLRRGLM